MDQGILRKFQDIYRNLSELAATKTLIEFFKEGINALTVQDKGDAEIRDSIKLRQTRPFVTKDQGYLIAKKSVFNRIVGDSQLELDFAYVDEESFNKYKPKNLLDVLKSFREFMD